MSTYRLNSTRHAPDSADYRVYHAKNWRDIPQLARLDKERLFEMEVVSKVFPFKTNNFVIDNLIDWSDTDNDPIFALNFPHRDMLKRQDFRTLADLVYRKAEPALIEHCVRDIRASLNPHPAGQQDHNVPVLDGRRLPGMQHKYRETVLFFPSQGQTCHAYCTFCFRWPQFTGHAEERFASREIDDLIRYLRRHPEVTDVLFTGGDPMIMSSRVLANYVRPLLNARIPSLRRIRFGAKALTFWPHRFVTDRDADSLLALLGDLVDAGLHVAIMAHFNHPRELDPPVVREAIKRLRESGVEIRTQSPLLRPVNAKAEIWQSMWKTQVDLGCIPYYMFLARDTGAHEYFSVPLVRAWRIYRDAIVGVSGLARTVRGPSMSATPGKVEVMGISTLGDQKVITLRFLQGRDPAWVMQPFFGRHDEKATWLDELQPATGSRWFFEEAPEHRKAG